MNFAFDFDQRGHLVPQKTNSTAPSGKILELRAAPTPNPSPPRPAPLLGPLAPQPKPAELKLDRTRDEMTKKGFPF